MDPNMARAISGPANLMSKKMPLLFSKVAIGRAAARLGIGQYQVGDRGGMKALACAVALLGLAAAGPANALTILFMGNSFTYGEHSAAKRYHPETVTERTRTRPLPPSRWPETYKAEPVPTTWPAPTL